MMKSSILTGLLAVLLLPVLAQDMDHVINVAEVERIERTLSSDDLEGRKTFTPAIDRAADFIAAEFQKAGLQPVQGSSYFQSFTMYRTRFINASGKINDKVLAGSDIIALSTQPVISVNTGSGYELRVVGPLDTLFTVIRKLQEAKKNFLVVVDTVHRSTFNRFKSFRREMFPAANNIMMVLSSERVTTFELAFRQDLTEMPLKNVVGILPGKSRSPEYVIFSGHYDHLGIAKPNREADSIYNGANDDAAGTTAVIMLAHYFGQRQDNERTLIFAAFTAEEVGGYGSQHFSRQYDPQQVMAMFNIEMIGTESKWGPDAAYITGYEKSDMGKILEKNLAGSRFRFYPDPYTRQNLFYRSDNATLARLGVPAHTISTSRMEPDPSAVNKEVDKYYHTPDDEFDTLNMANMAAIIKAIAISSASIISGRDTPLRVDPLQVR